MKNIEEYKEKVNYALKNFLNNKLSKDSRYSEEIKELIENVAEFNMRGGKRIRPILIIFAYKCFKDEEHKIIDASICIELMQAYLLIHDDIIDNSDLRRGKPAMHKIYEKKFGKHFGLSMGILAGDLCNHYMYDSIIETKFSDTEKLNAISYVNWTANREIYGQSLDILPGFEEIKEEDILKIYELKTATYTSQGPIYIGCALADAPKDKIEKMQKYAYNIGIAFQLQDDLNGVFSKEEEIGKPVDSDIKEGKKTLLIAKTLELCSKQEKSFILSKYGRQEISEADIKEIRKIIKKSGAFDYCKNRFYEFIENGKNEIINLQLKEDGKKFLIELADYVKNLF